VWRSYEGTVHNLPTNIISYASSDKKKPCVRANAESGYSKELLLHVITHELAHNNLFKKNTGLIHPRKVKPKRDEGGNYKW